MPATLTPRRAEQPPPIPPEAYEYHEPKPDFADRIMDGIFAILRLAFWIGCGLMTISSVETMLMFLVVFVLVNLTPRD